MRRPRFIDESDAEFEHLNRRLDCAAVVRLRGQPLPPGCVPDEGDFGFEKDRRGKTRLLVTTGVVARRASEEIRSWLDAGVKQFDTFEEMKQWIRGPLAAAYRDGSPGQPTIIEPEKLNDAIRDLGKPLFVDEETLYAELTKLVKGQPAAMRALAATVSRHLARSAPARPATLCAIGPSGVGKSRSAEAIAKILSDSFQAAIGYTRLDMNLYQEPYRVSQLLGAPPGYVGHGDGSQLLDDLVENPKRVVHFDEIEKAHPAIHRALMNAMDAGLIESAAERGGSRQIDCRRAIFFFTSNLESSSILGELKTRKAIGDRAIEDEVCRRRLYATGIPPEIVGRIGRFLVYDELCIEARADIIAQSIVEVASEYGLRIDEVDSSVIIAVLERSRSEHFGVRPERTMIDDLLGDVFARTAAAGAPESNESPARLSGPPFKLVSLVN